MAKDICARVEYGGADPQTAMDELRRLRRRARREVVALDERGLEPAGDGVERDTQFLALTTNDELNLLASELAHHEFGVEHPVVALAAPSPEFGSQRRAWMDLLGGRAVQVDLWQRRLENGRARLLHVPLEHAEAADRLREIEEDLGDEAFIVCGWLDGEPRFRVSLDNLERLDRVTLLVTQGEAERRLETLLTELEALQAAEAETLEPGEAAGEAPEPAPRPLTHSSE